MDKIWGEYEERKEYIYAVDLETHELVYMNRSTREAYGLSSLEDVKGKKCYELLQRFAAPCAMCTDSKLEKGKWYEWEFYNPIMGKPYFLRDTLVEHNGRKYRLEMGRDISKESQRHRGVSSNTIIINEALRMALDEPNPDRAILRLLEYLGQALWSERAYIFEIVDEETIDNTYEWCAYNVTQEKDFLHMIPKSAAGIWFEEFAKNKYVIIPEVEAIKETDPVAYEYLVPQNVHSVAVSPLYGKDGIRGFYGFDNPDPEKMEDIIEILKTVGHFIDSLLERRKLLHQLSILSYQDQMTGIGNRHAIKKYYQNEEKQNSIGVVFCDVCGLKRINDTQGHDAGDDLLLRACDCLSQCFEGHGIFRYGGDEFLVLAFGISEQELNEKCEKLKRYSMEKDSPLAIGSLWKEKAPSNLKELLKEADEKMYEDKKEYYQNTNRRVSDDDQIIQAFARAIENHYIEVYYQPVIRTITGNICSMEALARWNDPAYGFLSPADFIPALEENKMIHLLDLYIIREICRKMQIVREWGIPMIPVSVNLSHLDFQSCDIFEEMEAILSEFNIPRYMIPIEITEFSVIYNTKTLQENVKRFKDAGYEIWMDNFGSGYFYLNLLNNYEFDEIKLGMAFLADFDERAQRIICASISMAKSLNVKTLAKGVETQEQLAYLKKIGCEKVQGNLIEKPAPFEEILTSYLKKGYGVESMDSREYYSKIGQVDFMTNYAIGITEFEENQLKLLYVSEALMKVWISAGVNTIDEISNLLNSPDAPLSQSLCGIHKNLKEGEVVNVSFSLNGRLLHGRVEVLAQYQQKHVAKVEMYSFAKNNMDPHDKNADYFFYSSKESEHES